jgi:UDP-galactopyranose mutase
LNIHSYQDNSVVNYPNDYEYTRITEFKKFYPNSTTFNCNKTVICKEIPWIWEIDAYPISSPENLELLKKYQNENKDSNVKFVWRLWNYSYFDMDKTIKNVLDLIN